MNRADFSKSCPGKLVRTVGDGWAFVPNPLPPSIQWDDDLAVAVSEAERAVGRLDGAGAQLPNPHFLITPFLKREAVLSSRIEGTQAMLTDLLMFDVEPDQVERRQPDVREVVNYVRALEYGLERLDTLPLSLRMICELHERLMSGVRGAVSAPGQFRRVQVLIGSPGCPTPDEARFVPPPLPEMELALQVFERYLHAPSKLPALVELALIHYQFESIHPFLDGNGRVGRLLISLWLCERRLLSQPLLFLSAYFEHRREEYYDRLLYVSLRNQWSEWVRFFLAGVVEQATDAVKRAGQLMQLREAFRHRLQKDRGTARTLDFADRLFQLPYITSSRAHTSLGISFKGAQGIIDKLVAADILREITGKARNRIYAAHEIVQIIDS